MINWISVNEMLPELFKDVVCWHAERAWFTGYLSRNTTSERVYWRNPDNDESYALNSITYWAYINMPGENE